ncbi:ATP-binding protein [Coraliomargarita sp. SDUM461004]|uniref:histidine kinase n=1 Tax=Thalassobacterium sedimentorum TaxID=3041258 RepID=A0ABU1ARG7_9BACT|nr:ATP-binding protein [Coraliomargarita sp. SDUM461004]MDQ8196208.1 ATP-binding protein [Coraliomargarita sp. SDUM461004]
MTTVSNSEFYKWIIILTLIAIHCLQVLKAQTTSLFIEEFTNDDHGGGSISSDILQVPSGTIFLINEAGLLKYDGEKWSGMPATGYASLITSATIDTKDRIWIAGIGSIGYYDSEDNNTYQFIDLTESLRSLPENRNLGTFWKIKHFQDCIFLITSNYVLQWENEKWKTWAFLDERRILPSWHDNELYIHDRGKGLYRFSENDFELIVSDTPEIASGIINIIDHTERGLLCVTVSNGLFWLKDQHLTRSQYDIHQTKITHAVRLKNGDLAIGTIAQGLKLLDQTGAVTNQVAVNPKPIYKTFESRDGSIWVVGVDKVYQIKNRFLTFINEGTQDILSAHNQIYYTTGHKLKSIPRKNQNQWPALRVLDEAASLWDIERVNEDLVYGTTSALRSLNSQSSKSSTPSARAITSIFPSKLTPDSIYTADVPKVSIWKKINESWKMLDTLQNFNSGAASLIELSDSRLMISDSKGSVYIANSPNRYSSNSEWKVLYPLGAEHGLSDGFIWAHCLSIQDTVIVISDQGLYCYDNDTQMFHYVPVLGNNLGSDAYGLESCPLADGSGWALRLETYNSQGKKKNRVGRLILDAKGKLRWEPWNLPSLNQAGKVEALLHQETDGTEVLWVGGSQSLLRYDLSALSRIQLLPTVITTIRERSKSKTYFGGAGSVNESYEWEYPQQSLRIEYASPPSTIAVDGYQTRLIGFNEKWSEFSQETFSDFTNLHEGSYRFEVRAIDEFGRNGTISSFGFLIHPPWYRTTYAYAAGCVTLAFSVWYLIRLRNQHLTQRNEELEELINERTCKIESQKLELEQSYRTKQNFLASMSHEIRNPLNGILGIVRLMHENESQLGNKSKEVTHLYTSTSHLHQLLGQTLDYSSLESGKLRARIETIEVYKLLDDVVDMHRSMAYSKGLSLVSETPDRPCYCKGDPVLLRQILANLVSNALKYTDKGSVSLKLSHQKDEDTVLATFEVTDTGPGIPEDKRSYIFEEFTRLSRPGESSIPGTGLGLAIASEMAKLMGGTLNLDPSYTTGARFLLKISLELDHYAAVTSKRINTNPKLLDGQSALVADDLDFNRYLHSEILKRMGAKAHTVSNGQEALLHLSECQCELALLDVNMPGLTGMDVVRQYLADQPDNPPKLIALSAYNTPEMEQKCLDAGFDHFLEKPLEPSKLICLLGHHRIFESNAPSSMLDYIANGDSTVMAELETNYNQSVKEGLQELQQAWNCKDIPRLPDIIHKLIGLTSIRKDVELTDKLYRLSNAVKQTAPEADIKAAIHEVLDQIH